MTEPKQREPGLRLIVLYKVARAIGAGALGLTVAILTLAGVADHANTFVNQLHDHATSALGLEVSGLAVSLLKGQHVWIIVIALVLDAGVLSVEAYALFKRWAWGEWLVVATSSALLPFEVLAIVRQTSAIRVGVLIINLSIVGYLLARMGRKRS